MHASMIISINIQCLESQQSSSSYSSSIGFHVPSSRCGAAPSTHKRSKPRPSPGVSSGGLLGGPHWTPRLNPNPRP